MTQEPSRRNVLKLLLNFTWIAPLLIGLRQMFRFMRYEPPATNMTRFTLNTTPPGLAFNPAYIENARVWLHQDAQGLYAIDAICTHLGCVVNRDEQGFACPCHGSRFTPMGVVLNGPATESLHYVLLEYASDGRLIIDRGQGVSAEFRLGAG